MTELDTPDKIVIALIQHVINGKEAVEAIEKLVDDAAYNAAIEAADHAERAANL